MKLLNIAKVFFLMVALTLVLPACGTQKPETFNINGQLIEGTLTISAGSERNLIKYEFNGRVTGNPSVPFEVNSQEESVSGESNVWAKMDCSVNDFGISGEAYVYCFVEVPKKSRQNAIILSSPLQGDIILTYEHIQYRANIIDSHKEEVEQMDYLYSQVGLEPTNIENAVEIYYRLGLDVEEAHIMDPIPHFNEDMYMLPQTYAPQYRGFYLVFVSEIGCHGSYTQNHLQLYRYDGKTWQHIESMKLDDVNFNYESGVHDFAVFGHTLSLEYSHNLKCGYEWEEVTLH